MRKFSALVLALILSLSLFAGCGNTEPALNEHNDPAVEQITFETQQDLITAMGMGWNLGNTLDAPEGETAWGQPVTTPEMVAKIKELGFNTIRIPVSWGKHTSGENNTIDPEWMARVREIVDYAMDSDLIVIMNSHHDNDYYNPRKNNADDAVKYISDIWTQIATEFKDYDQTLIFEAMNEPRLDGSRYEWGLDMSVKECQTAVDIINKCNQAFVDAVRSSGGNNADRYLLSSVYCGATYSAIIDEYLVPTDTATNKIMIAVHAYTPYNLAMGTDNKYVNFGSSEKGSIDHFMKQLHEKYVSNGIHVVIDEMGIINKGNPDARYEWAKYYVSKAKELGMACVVWDNQHNDFGEESYGLFDRYNLKIFDESEMVWRGFMDAINGEE